ncbi:DUF2510 domain-containing protein [Nocardia sp. NPDC088792]|uniref:DUF2510 domain-containing protein n=1 Tax=Nocardia sp. NPDC088792 TaxID=3364332 RepID=UPI0038103937
MVRFRTPQERTARFTRQTRNAARKSVKLQATEVNLQRWQLAASVRAAQPVRPAPVPAGWYASPGRPGLVQWWDGIQWTSHIQQLQPQRWS